ncbi:MAG: ComF family protein [Fimbriimonadaceae bacterium]
MWAWLYPPACALCGRLGEPAICPACEETFRAAGPWVILPEDPMSVDACFLYQERAAQAVKRLKYERASPLRDPMARMMAARHFITDDEMVVPVPIHWTRRFERGFNQSEWLASQMPQATRALRRIRATRPQVGLNRAARQRNIIGAFAASPLVKGRRVVLVDDVITSGSTVLACREALRQAGAAEVRAIAFCSDQLAAKGNA